MGAMEYGCWYLRSHMMLSGQIENWNVVVDLAKLGVTEVPKKDL